jgi:hypothetical protein
VRARAFNCLGLVCGILLSAQSVAPTHAANINTTATHCQVTFAPSDQLVHVAWGVMTLSTTATPQMVACTLPRAPLTAGVGSGFYVDGDNFNGASTSCTLFAFDSDGHLAGAASFQTAAAQYDMFLSLDASRLADLGHTSLRCLLPAQGNGTLRGVTSIQ